MVRRQLIPDDEVQQLKDFIRALIGNLRMNYGVAMAEIGLNADQIISIQQKVAAANVEWLEKS